jgi:hypothetical protein
VKLSLFGLKREQSILPRDRGFPFHQKILDFIKVYYALIVARLLFIEIQQINRSNGIILCEKLVLEHLKFNKLETLFLNNFNNVFLNSNLTDFWYSLLKIKNNSLSNSFTGYSLFSVMYIL